MKVYTSLSRDSAQARGCGEDAIRVCVVRYYAWHTTEEHMDLAGIGGAPGGLRAHGVADFPRVYRTGSVEAVLDRMIDRAREAYAFVNESLKKQRETSR